MTALSPFAPNSLRAFTSAGNRSKEEDGSARRLLPFALIPLGTAYCQVHEFFFEDSNSSLWGSVSWAFATLMPWVVAAIIFEWSVRPGERRSALLQRAAFLGVAAYLASGVAAMLLGATDERAFYSRLPLLAAAMLTAALYPVRALEDAVLGVAANENSPPVAPTEIVYASAAGNYVELHAGVRTIIWRQTMQNAERILAPAGFVRVHRSYLVPWRSIERVAKSRKGPVAVALRDGPRLPVSTRYAANLKGKAA